MVLVRSQVERDRQTVRIVRVLPLVVLALALVVAPIVAGCAALGLLDGVGPGLIPIIVAAYFVYALVGVARRQP